MKTKEQLEQSYDEIINKINEYCDKLVDAMCSGEVLKERQYKWGNNLIRAKERYDWMGFKLNNIKMQIVFDFYFICVIIIYVELIINKKGE